jgi:hypothetical protein
MTQTVPFGFLVAAGLLALAVAASACAPARGDAGRSSDVAETAACALPPVDDAPQSQGDVAPAVGIPPLDAHQPGQLETATFALG